MRGITVFTTSYGLRASVTDLLKVPELRLL